VLQACVARRGAEARSGADVRVAGTTFEAATAVDEPERLAITATAISPPPTIAAPMIVSSRRVSPGFFVAAVVDEDAFDGAGDDADSVAAGEAEAVTIGDD
jgi:hypothetical protein